MLSGFRNLGQVSMATRRRIRHGSVPLTELARAAMICAARQPYNQSVNIVESVPQQEASLLLAHKGDARLLEFVRFLETPLLFVSLKSNFEGASWDYPESFAFLKLASIECLLRVEAV